MGEGLAFDWRPSELVVLMLLDRCIATIPIDFLETARIRNWTYIRYVLKALLKNLPSEIQITKEGLPVSEDKDELVAGTYTIITTPELYEVEFHKGPQGKSLSRVFHDWDSRSTVSASSQASENPPQTLFRESLLIRDGQCVVSGRQEEIEDLVACHIVPQSLGQRFLNGITAQPNTVVLYGARSGLLLYFIYHKTFDRYKWGIWYHEGDYFLHSFEPDDKSGMSTRRYHGHKLLFRGKDKARRPEPALVEWHYRQCLMARVRSADFEE